MSRTVFFYAQTLDGYIAERDGGIDWLTGHDAGSRIEGLEPVLGAIDEFLTGIGAFAMGSATYGHILERATGWPYTGGPSWVFTSRELPVAEGGDIRFTQGPVAEVHAEMTEAAGERGIWIVGGGALAQDFHDEGLLDEIHVTIVPSILGDGVPALPRRMLAQLEPTAVRPFANGMVELRYAVLARR